MKRLYSHALVTFRDFGLFCFADMSKKHTWVFIFVQISAFLHYKYCLNVREGFVATSFSLKCFSFLNVSLSDSPSLHFSCTPTQQKHIRKGVNWPISVNAEKTSTEELVWRFSQRLFQMSWMKRSLSLWILTGLKTNVLRHLFNFDYRRWKTIVLFRNIVFFMLQKLSGWAGRDSLLQLW